MILKNISSYIKKKKSVDKLLSFITKIMYQKNGTLSKNNHNVIWDVIFKHMRVYIFIVMFCFFSSTISIPNVFPRKKKKKCMTSSEKCNKTLHYNDLPFPIIYA